MHFFPDSRFLPIVSVILVLSATSLPADGLSEDIPDSLRSVWETLTADHPLPEPSASSEDPRPDPSGTRSTPEGVLRLRRISFRTPVPARAEPVAFRTTGRTKIVARTIFAPAVPLWDERRTAALEGLAARALADGARTFEAPAGTGSAGEETYPLQVLPLEEIRPPLRALPVDGMYAGDPGYPLVEKVVLSLDSSDPALASWFAAIPEPPAVERPVWIAGVGDIMVGRGVEEILISGPRGIERIFGDTLPHLRAADILTGNLEGAVTRRGEPLAKGYTFRFRPAALGPLAEAGFDYLSLTNNHAYDYGEEGFTDTLDHLAEYGIATSGAGRTPDEAAAFSSFSIRGREVRILSVGDYPVERSGFSGLRDAAVTDRRPGILFRSPLALDAVRRMASPESFDVVLVHGGYEWVHEPVPAQQRFYRLLAEQGADLVLGSHPHVLQGMESCRGMLIAYSLGNFVFPGMGGMDRAEESMILSVGVWNGAIRYLRMIPVQIDYRTLSTDRSGAILKRFLEMTRRLHE